MFSKTRVTEPGPRAYPQDSEVNRPVMDTKPDFPAAPQAMRPRSGPSVLSSDLTVKGNITTQGDAQIEVRASWTPHGDLEPHATAWMELLGKLAGLPPLAPGVVPLTRRRAIR